MWDFIAEFFLDWLFYTAEPQRPKRAGCATVIMFVFVLLIVYYLYRVFFKP